MKHSSAFTIFKISILLLIVYLFLGCKRTPPLLTYRISKNALAYIQFTTGKYFIYRDSATNKTDSVLVTQSLLQPYDGKYNETNLSFDGQEYSFVLTQIDAGNTTVWLSGDAKENFAICALFSNSLALPNESLYRENATIIPTMVVEGKTYTDVNLTSDGFFAFYWAKGVGIIKRSDGIGPGTTTTYTLLRNN